MRAGNVERQKFFRKALQKGEWCPRSPLAGAFCNSAIPLTTHHPVFATSSVPVPGTWSTYRNITAANREGVDPLKYSQRFTDRCLDDLDTLGIRRADLYPKASETIPDMIQMIEQILKRNYGYVVNGDVYFSVEKFSSYGKLSGQDITEMKKGTRIEAGEQKRSPLDFALWKKAKPGEPTRPSPWGAGRPGWHIECSAMSSKFLGLPFDIHGGGMDLQFPHHENEVAQAAAKGYSVKSSLGFIT